ncbi:hypothetical protein E2L06_01335 [Haloterrigena sp. H1]|uniref:hypothetical protein n=1 Tax=Haloterrigena sp. H1 TaxID=2552943 RepID=UPI00110DC3B1|nr:hypothetical protein [Haloterrigena sp. H1]TMT85316.1 hypothetical protein E2L06_01335 [Haloterrigena sp. H1]
MREYLESDLGFYYGVGAFIIAIFVIGLIAVAIIDPDGVDTVGLVGLTGGFFVFMLVYFVSISIQRLEDGENV